MSQAQNVQTASSSNVAANENAKQDTLYTLKGVVSELTTKKDKNGADYRWMKFTTMLQGRETTRVTMAFGKAATNIDDVANGEFTLCVVIDGGTFKVRTGGAKMAAKTAATKAANQAKAEAEGVQQAA